MKKIYKILVIYMAISIPSLVAHAGICSDYTQWEQKVAEQDKNYLANWSSPACNVTETKIRDNDQLKFSLNNSDKVQCSVSAISDMKCSKTSY